MNEQILWILGIELLLLTMLCVGKIDLLATGLATMGVILVMAVQDAIVLFGALEMVSGCTWLTLYHQRISLSYTSASASELTTRHVLLSLMGSALLLLGLSIICGTTGTIDLQEIHAQSNNAPPELIRLAIALILAGLGIRLGVVPFALHIPHTCQLITNRGTTQLLLLPWFAGTITLVRLLATILPGLSGACWPIAGLLAVISMGYAGLSAISEQNVRKLMSYILIVQSGLILLGPVAAFSQAAVSDMVATDSLASRALGGSLFCLLATGPSAIGALGVLVYLRREDGQIDVVDELAGLGRTRPWIAAAMALFLLSLAGVPPLAGFWARTAVLIPTVSVTLMANSPERWWFVALAVAAGLGMVVTMVVCTRLVAVMYFRLPLATPKAQGGRMASTAIIGCATLTVLIGLGFFS
ncbi:MAG: hypothetical protein JXM70_29875 [Pirellulales bacterium]|nr:hypothetical protein [Pirellulales bacterium]